MLYFHENCTADILAVIAELKKQDNESLAEFKAAIIDTYQRIYADEHGQHQVWSYNNASVKAIRYNVEPIRGFPYVVIFQKEKGKKIILGVVYNRKSLTRYV